MADLDQQTEELFQGGTADQWSDYVDTLKVDIPEVSFKEAATFVAEMTVWCFVFFYALPHHLFDAFCTLLHRSAHYRSLTLCWY